MSKSLGDRLHEVNMMLNAAGNGLATRRAHPSYGYTKKDIQTQLDLAEGMIRLEAYSAGIVMHVHVPSSQWAEDDSVPDRLEPLQRAAQRRNRLQQTLNEEGKVTA